MTNTKWLLAALGLAWSTAAAAQPTLTGAGVTGAACAPFTYPATPAYQSLGFADTWTQQQVTLANNQVSSPACAITGATITETATTNVHGVQKGVSVTITAKSYTFTTWAQRGVGTRNFSTNLNDSTLASEVGAVVDLSNCSTHSSFGFGNYTLTSVTPSQVGAWCKVVIVFSTSAADTAVVPQLYETDATFTLSYLGTTGSIAIWGLDLR